MSNLKASDVAKWFIKNDLDNPRDTFDGNMKLQKLLFFSQLIHLAKFDRPLFQDDMKAYRNGSVINEVRMAYKSTPTLFIQESKRTNFQFDDQINETLKLTADIFGGMTADELSDLNHELSSWKFHYHSSVTDNPNVYDNYKNTIVLDGELLKRDVKKIKQMLNSYESNKENNTEEFEVINGVTYYFDPNEVELTEDILAELEEMDCPDDAYTLTYDEEQGLILL